MTGERAGILIANLIKRPAERRGGGGRGGAEDSVPRVDVAAALAPDVTRDHGN